MFGQIVVIFLSRKKSEFRWSTKPSVFYFVLLGGGALLGGGVGESPTTYKPYKKMPYRLEIRHHEGPHITPAKTEGTRQANPTREGVYVKAYGQPSKKQPSAFKHPLQCFFWKFSFILF